MNEEILFRGKRVDNGELIESDSIHQLYGGSKVYLWYQGEWVEVVSKTIGEYTGLTDKNGKKIFEGDIIKDVFMDKLGLVFWYAKATSFYVSWAGIWGVLENAEDSEVLGNKHDNPELLEENKK